MDLNLLKNFVDYGILGFLVFLSIISLTILIERLIFYKKIDMKKYDSRKILEIDLTKNLTTMGSIASNAPYIGLLGTVISIMITFASISSSGLNASKITSALALALKSTAAGLIVAIFSMFFYNALLRSVETILARYDDEKI
jgi:biopolymer transport protein ExbB